MHFVSEVRTFFSVEGKLRFSARRLPNLCTEKYKMEEFYGIYNALKNSKLVGIISNIIL